MAGNLFSNSSLLHYTMALIQATNAQSVTYALDRIEAEGLVGQMFGHIMPSSTLPWSNYLSINDVLGNDDTLDAIVGNEIAMTILGRRSAWSALFTTIMLSSVTHRMMIYNNPLAALLIVSSADSSTVWDHSSCSLHTITVPSRAWTSLETEGTPQLSPSGKYILTGITTTSEYSSRLSLKTTLSGGEIEITEDVPRPYSDGKGLFQMTALKSPYSVYISVTSSRIYHLRFLRCDQ